MSQLIPFEGSKVPAYLKTATVLSDLSANVGSGGFPVMSIKGKVFALVEGGERTTLMNPNDEDAVATSINVVIIKANAGLSKVWYAKSFVEGSDAKPDCFSHDGTAPDPSVEHPPAKKCSICPKNQWGSKVSDDGKKLKACADSRRLAIANLDAIDNPILLRVPPASLKPLSEFGNKLAERGAPYYAVVTKIGFDPEAASPKLTFKPTGWLSNEQFAQVSAAQSSEAVQSILGSHGEPPVANVDELDGAPPVAVAAPAPAPAPAKKVAQKAEPKPEPEEEVAAAPAPAPVKKAAKPVAVASGDSLEDELDNLLGSLDD